MLLLLLLSMSLSPVAVVNVVVVVLLSPIVVVAVVLHSKLLWLRLKTFSTVKSVIKRKKPTVALVTKDKPGTRDRCVSSPLFVVILELVCDGRGGHSFVHTESYM